MESVAFGKRRGESAKADTGRAVLRGHFFGCKGAAEGMRFFPGMEILMGSAKRGLAVFISSFPQNGFFTSVKEVCEREETKTFERE